MKVDIDMVEQFKAVEQAASEQETKHQAQLGSLQQKIDQDVTETMQKQEAAMQQQQAATQ